MAINVQICPRADTAAAWTSANPVLALREMARETDTGRLKFGNGTTAWNSLAYWQPGTDDEAVRDVIGAALAAADGLAVTVNDAGDTITVGVADGHALPLAGGGSPEGVVSAPVGTLYLRSDGGAGTTLYVKETGTGNTGWAAK
ncbi:UNVERIFIED_ORG: hypothetical protein M2348_001060 [Sphingomonas sp. R1F5B]